MADEHFDEAMEALIDEPRREESEALRKPTKTGHVRLSSLPVTFIGKRSCATEGCGSDALWHVVSGDIGSYYCGACADTIMKMVEKQTQN